MFSPTEHLAGAGQMYPAAWKQIEMFRSSRGQDGVPDWPDWCFLPLSAFYAIVSEGGLMDLNRVPDVARLGAIGTWRYSQGIYRIDPDVYHALLSTPLTGDIPAEVLYRLPEWCVYIETPGAQWFGGEMAGFWAHLEHDVNTERTELRLVLNLADNLIPIVLHVGQWPLTESITRALDESNKQAAIYDFGQFRAGDYPKASADELQGVLSLILYLCSEEPEIDDERSPGAHPARPRPTRTKKGWRLFPAQRPRIWRVGSELGKQMRDALIGDSTHKTTPHLRRAHWHGFWRGPRDGDRKFFYKWIPAIFVRGSEESDNEQNKN